MSISFFGIRHHGPGSARSVLRALEKLDPDLVMIEGPPEGEVVINSVINPEMKAPVALLAYDKNNAQYAAFYPFAEFSPEWQALKYALRRQKQVRFMDLALSHKFALVQAKQKQSETEEPLSLQKDYSNKDSITKVDEDKLELDFGLSPHKQLQAQWKAAILKDPLAYFGQLAGFYDGEAWWERQVELLQADDQSLFKAIAEMMTELREALGGWSYPDSDIVEDLQEFRREASMRKLIRKAQKEGHERIAVICGAWHVPALMFPPKVKEDSKALKSLPKVKVKVTWVPWTYRRMSVGSGYSAGVESPGFYEHLWEGHQNQASFWLSKVAQALRSEGYDVSSAHIIETLRLAEALCALRDLPSPRLTELNEAIRTVMLFGDELPLELIQKKLMIGQRLGQVPSDLPETPLQSDVRILQKKLRLAPKAESEEKIIDLRKTIDLDRSQFLHRLNLLDITWGELGHARSEGTFKEAWILEWKPEFSLDIIDRSPWGQTIQEASTNYALHQAREADLKRVIELSHQSLVANLPKAIPVLMTQLADQAALSSDIAEMLEALPALAQLLRYSDVRGRKATAVSKVLRTLAPRASVGLVHACSALNNDASEQMVQLLEGATQALLLIDESDLSELWFVALHKMIKHERIHFKLKGKACRLLVDAQELEEPEMIQAMSLALSRAIPPEDSAAWLEGFLSGSGQVLVYDDQLWALIDHWVCGLSSDVFMELLPLIRRTFSSFTAHELRQLGERVKTVTPNLKTSGLIEEIKLNHEHAKLVLPIISRFLAIASNRQETKAEVVANTGLSQDQVK